MPVAALTLSCLCTVQLLVLRSIGNREGSACPAAVLGVKCGADRTSTVVELHRLCGVWSGTCSSEPSVQAVVHNMIVLVTGLWCNASGLFTLCVQVLV